MIKRDVYQEITDRVVKALESGVAPWVRPWSDRGGLGVAPGMPHNAVSKRQYSGVNVPLLWLTASERGYRGNGWVTFNQCREAGGMVRKGERGTTVVFAKQIRKEDEETGKTTSFPILKTFTLFHVSQCEGLPETVTGEPEPVRVEPDRVLDWAVRRGVRVEHGGAKAFYTVRDDHVQMPPKAAFRDAESYAATLLHEVTHWSGGPARLNRQFGKRFGDEAYAAEELVAEMGAAFLCARLGVRGELQHESYIASWLKALRNDKRFLFAAASAAGKATDYLFGLVEDEEEHEEEFKPDPNVIYLPAPAPVLLLPKPEDFIEVWGEPVEPVPPVAPRYVEPIPYPNDYTARGDTNAVSLLGLALASQAEACRKRRRYTGSVPLSASQRRLYEAGIGHASGYWKDYAASQRVASVAPSESALIEYYERRGIVPSLASVRGCPRLIAYRDRMLASEYADAAE